MKSIPQNFKYIILILYFLFKKISFLFKFIHISSNERQMELFQKYTNDDLSSYAQSIINWKLMFQYLQDYRKKAVEQSRISLIF
jgi:hypothetical protein